ncbi:MAG: hypothetical protein II367_02580 [Treponema sp.]|nr:hypothetical protein [Treponema sp.]
MKGFLTVLFSLLVVSALVSCTKNKEIVFDNSTPLAMAPDVQWALVVDPYSAFRKEASWTAEVIGHCRKGEIFQVQGASFDEERELWFDFTFGWLPASSVEVYSNKFKAETAASLLK